MIFTVVMLGCQIHLEGDVITRSNGKTGSGDGTRLTPFRTHNTLESTLGKFNRRRENRCFISLHIHRTDMVWLEHRRCLIEASRFSELGNNVNINFCCFWPLRQMTQFYKNLFYQRRICSAVSTS